tara:strand:+ start:3103 stop:3483 length:381 start_codon:yes stop_codon:yes gene_type:complete
MPYLFVRDYETELMEMNKDLHHVYVESHGGSGGERKIVRLRLNERGLSLTLRDNYSELGTLTSNTEKRDITTLESELQKIGRASHSGVIVCVPLSRLTNELSIIEKLSPKVAGYVVQRIGSIGMQL